MTDTPKPLKVFTCFDPTGRTKYCHALIEDTDEVRREHRAWHAHEEAVKTGLRTALLERDKTIGELARQLEDLGRDVTGIEIPQPVLGLEINRDGYSDDELDTDYHLEPAPVSTYATEDVNATIAMDPADLPTPRTAYSSDLA